MKKFDIRMNLKLNNFVFEEIQNLNEIRIWTNSKSERKKKKEKRKIEKLKESEKKIKKKQKIKSGDVVTQLYPMEWYELWR